MSLFLILTADQAAAVSGSTDTDGLSVGLAPVPLADGSFALPIAVLADPSHAAQHDTLAALPQQAVDPSQWPVTS